MSSAVETTSRPSRRKQPRSALARLVSDPMGAFGLALIVFTVVAALLADLAPFAPAKINPVDRFSVPSALHWLGTDNLGRDLFSRVLHGARIALAISIGATLLSLVVGLLLGVVAGFGPRWLDSLLLLVMDAMKSVPTVMLALLLITYTGPSLWAVVLVVVLVNGPGYARITRTQVLALRNAEFIEAERALGARFFRIVAFHIMPNILGPLLIMAAMDIPVVVGIEAGLSFLGMGVRPPTPSWGTILFDGFSYIRDSIWMVVAGGLPIVITALGFTFLGEALRDTFDPKLAQR